jgi:DNA-binding NtrC family response regulator
MELDMKESLRVLVVDDEQISRRSTKQQLEAAGYTAEAVENAYAALERLEATPWDVVVTDLRMPGMDGIEFLREAKKRRSEIDVVVMTAYGTVETAVAAMREGAADYLTKPFRFPELDLRLQRLGDQRETKQELERLRGLVGEGASIEGILGRSVPIQKACELVQLFAKSTAPVLIAGETGTGKELFARSIHNLGARSRHAFVAVPCGAIPKELAESQLFGHEKGAFTGAIASHRGFFEEASGGTLVLDDVEDLPLELQAKLLHVLQEGLIRRVGAESDLEVDVRMIATTKVDLGQAVAEKRFREDLYYRLRGLEIRLPPLRERDEDILLLAQHFLRLLASKEGAAPKALSVEAASLLRRHTWPGNVRELRRVMESAVTLCQEAEIRPQHLPEQLTAKREDARLFSLQLDTQIKVSLSELVKDFENALIQWAMRRAHGQQSVAAEILGVPRTTLQSKLGRPRGV